MLIVISGQVSFPRNKELFWGVVGVGRGLKMMPVFSLFNTAVKGEKRLDCVCV